MLRLKDLHAATTEAMKHMTGDEPVVIEMGGGPAMPVGGLEAAGLKLFDNGRFRGATIVRDETTDCECGCFVIVQPPMVSTEFWHRELVPDAATK